jgi:hypothetical protein
MAEGEQLEDIAKPLTVGGDDRTGERAEIELAEIAENTALAHDERAIAVPLVTPWVPAWRRR